MAAQKTAKTAQNKKGNTMKPRQCACGVTVSDPKKLRTSIGIEPRTTARGTLSMKRVKHHGCDACITTVAAK